MSILKPTDSTCVGVDFGTTNCSVCLFNGQYELVEFNEYGSLFPSMIFNSNGLSPKRLVSESIGTKESIIEACASFFLHLRQMTNRHFKKNLRNAIITVPARFDDIQRGYIGESAMIAGWNVVRLLPEPTAAFLSLEKPNGIYGVYDLGGGTFDFSVLRKENEIVQVLSTTGSTNIGCEHFKKLIDKNIQCLSEVTNTDLESCEPIINQTIAMVRESLIESVSEIILVGGGANIKLVQEKVSKVRPVTIASQPQLSVVRGAARHGYMIGSENYLLIDVLPLSIGIEIANGLVEVLLPRNTPIPSVKEIQFTNLDKNQTHISLHLVQGESILAKECRSLGRFEVGIDPGPPGTAIVNLRCVVDPTGTIEVICNGVQFKTSLSTGLSQELVDELIHAGQSNLREKELQRKLILTLTRIDSILNQFDCHDYEIRRSEVKNWQDADLLLAEIEKKFLPIFETKLIEKIQKYLTS